MTIRAKRTGRVRSQDEFARLASGGVRSRARTAVGVTYVPPPDPAATGVHVAFAIGRTVGTAVVRNRMRRRLRAAMAELAPPPGTYLLRATPPAAVLPYASLRAELASGIAEVTSRAC